MSSLDVAEDHEGSEYGVCVCVRERETKCTRKVGIQMPRIRRASHAGNYACEERV